jgi:hypothetical protein
MPRSRVLRASIGLGGTALAVVLLTAGLALAGVNLPGSAKPAFERVGISLPNQAGGDGGQSADHPSSDEVKPVIDATEPSDRGCSFGHRVAEAAKGSPLPTWAQSACSHAASKRAARKNDGPASPAGSSNARREFGKDTSERARGLKDATVDQRRQFGRDTAEGAKQLGTGHPSTPASKPTAGPPGGTPSAPPAGPPASTPSGPPAGAPRGRP